MRRYVSSALLVAVVAVSILSLSQVEAATITEWTIPTAYSYPYDVFVDGDLVYFTAYFFDRVGVLKWEYPYP